MTLRKCLNAMNFHANWLFARCGAQREIAMKHELRVVHSANHSPRRCAGEGGAALPLERTSPRHPPTPPDVKGQRRYPKPLGAIGVGPSSAPPHPWLAAQ